MAFNRSKPVLVVGGGIGGVAAALALARKGIPVRVFEQSAAFREVGAGIQLGPNVFRALRKLGLHEAVTEDAWRPTTMEMRDAINGELVTRIPLNTDAFNKRFGEPYAVTHRADLHGAIVAACRDSNLVSLETSRRVVDVNESPSVGVILESGERVEGSAVIGADGMWSAVRQQIVGDGSPRVSGHIAYRAVLKREDVPDDLWLPDVVLWAGPRTHLVHYPLRRGELFNLVAVFHSEKYVEGWNAEGDVAELRRHFQGQRPEVLRLLDKIETWRMWVLCDREPIKLWSKGSVALLGDAAHPMLQYLAQGACMAIEDAVCLAEEIERRPDDVPAALRVYGDSRYLRTGRVQLMARVYGEFYHASGVAAELRNAMLASRTVDQAYDGVAWLYGEAA